MFVVYAILVGAGVILSTVLVLLKIKRIRKYNQ